MPVFTNEPSGGTLDPTKNNVEAIARLEREALQHRTSGERLSDVVIRVVGTFASVVVHLVWFGAWVAVNLGFVPGLSPFDPFPFGILTLLVSGEGVMLALFILISQNRMTRQADRRAHLGLQVSMLAEQELTLLLQMQNQILTHLGIPEPGGEGDARLAEKTDLQEVVRELEARLPES